MIHYRQDWWFGFRILCHIHGSVVPSALPRAIISGLLCFSFVHWRIVSPEQGGNLMWHPACFILFFQVSAYVLAFHTNQAYNRYWEARSQVQMMASYWGDVASQYIAFDEIDELIHKEPNPACMDGPSWRARITHLISLLHAVCIQYLLNDCASDTQLEVLGGISKTEAELLSAVEDQAYLVMHWISQEAGTRIATGGLASAAPILSRSWQMLSLGMLSYNQACKIEDTPFPFPYVQLLHLMDWIMTLVCPVVMAAWVNDKAFSIALTIMVVGAFHAMFAAACIMETPFGKSSNDLPLIELHKDFLSRLKSIIDKKVAAKLNASVLEEPMIPAAPSFKRELPISFLPPLSSIEKLARRVRMASHLKLNHHHHHHEKGHKFNFSDSYFNLIHASFIPKGEQGKGSMLNRNHKANWLDGSRSKDEGSRTQLNGGGIQEENTTLWSSLRRLFTCRPRKYMDEDSTLSPMNANGEATTTNGNIASLEEDSKSVQLNYEENMGSNDTELDDKMTYKHYSIYYSGRDFHIAAAKQQDGAGGISPFGREGLASADNSKNQNIEGRFQDSYRENNGNSTLPSGRSTRLTDTNNSSPRSKQIASNIRNNCSNDNSKNSCEINSSKGKQATRNSDAVEPTVVPSSMAANSTNSSAIHVLNSQRNAANQRSTAEKRNENKNGVVHLLPAVDKTNNNTSSITMNSGGINDSNVNVSSNIGNPLTTCISDDGVDSHMSGPGSPKQETLTSKGAEKLTPTNTYTIHHQHSFASDVVRSFDNEDGSDYVPQCPIRHSRSFDFYTIPMPGINHNVRCEDDDDSFYFQRDHVRRKRLGSLSPLDGGPGFNRELHGKDRLHTIHCAEDRSGRRLKSDLGDSSRIISCDELLPMTKARRIGSIHAKKVNRKKLETAVNTALQIHKKFTGNGPS